MKLTIEPTIHPPREGIPSPTVSVSYPDDDLNACQMVMDLVVPALMAAGYDKPGILHAFRKVLEDHAMTHACPAQKSPSRKPTEIVKDIHQPATYPRSTASASSRPRTITAM